MTKIEIQLYAIDENTQNLRHLAHQTNIKKFLPNSNSNKSNMQRKQLQPRDLTTIRCYKRNKMGHCANKCPTKITLNNQEQGNSATSKEITSQNTDVPEAHINNL